MLTSTHLEAEMTTSSHPLSTGLLQTKDWFYETQQTSALYFVGILSKTNRSHCFNNLSKILHFQFLSHGLFSSSKLCVDLILIQIKLTNLNSSPWVLEISINQISGESGLDKVHTFTFSHEANSRKRLTLDVFALLEIPKVVQARELSGWSMQKPKHKTQRPSKVRLHWTFGPVLVYVQKCSGEQYM